MNNPGAFLRRLPNADALLRICGSDLTENASDYEFLCALCNASDKLLGNRLLLALSVLLTKNGCDARVAPENAEAIWRFFSEKPFWKEPEACEYAMQAVTDLPVCTLCKTDYLPFTTLVEAAHSAADPAAFEQALRSAFLASQKCGVAVDLPDEVYTKQPNLYAVTEALSGKGDASVLLLQALRVLAKEQIPILLFLRASGEYALAFFLRLSSLVGISRLALVLSPASFANAIDFLMTCRKADFLAVLQEEDSKTLTQALSYDYPIENCRLLLQE